MVSGGAPAATNQVIINRSSGKASAGSTIRASIEWRKLYWQRRKPPMGEFLWLLKAKHRSRYNQLA
jgi:hypothetical protein